MTREEEIKQASNITFKIGLSPRTSFIRGAEWSDRHPSVNTVKKIVCYALKHTNIVLAEDLENGVEWELLIKKAMED